LRVRLKRQIICPNLDSVARNRNANERDFIIPVPRSLSLSLSLSLSVWCIKFDDRRKRIEGDLLLPSVSARDAGRSSGRRRLWLATSARRSHGRKRSDKSFLVEAVPCR